MTLMVLVAAMLVLEAALLFAEAQRTTGYAQPPPFAYEGRIAEVVAVLNPKGTVELDGKYWNATSETPAAAGEQVRVVGRKGLCFIVEPSQQ